MIVEEIFACWVSFSPQDWMRHVVFNSSRRVEVDCEIILLQSTITSDQVHYFRLFPNHLQCVGRWQQPLMSSQHRLHVSYIFTQALTGLLDSKKKTRRDQLFQHSSANHYL